MHARTEGASLSVRTVADRAITPALDLSRPAGLRVHLIGIGGSGMSGVAALLHDLGATVSGSDLSSFDGMGSLVSRGVRVFVGHEDGQLGRDVDMVVVSAAIPESNPELRAARRGGLPILKYAELVGALSAVHKGVAIAGTHGKSTTTGMTAYLFRQAGLSPSFLIGARSPQLGGSSGAGTGPHFIVESCEFDRSFLHLHPHQAAILNIETDHLDCYHDLEEIVDAFAQFAARVDSQGVVLCNGENDSATRAASAATARVETFGFSEGVDWRAVNLRSDNGRFAFEIELRGSRLLSTHLAIAGRHNVANALAAVALAYHAGAEPERVAEALPTFQGVDRRMTWRGEGRGLTVVDDYAHHPTEIRVTIEAIRNRYHPKRLWVVFQPHQDSRTRYFMEEFAASFGNVDEVLIPDVYRARDRETSEGQPGSLELAERIGRGGIRARYFPALDMVADVLVHEVQDGDLVLTMGAGDVWKVADELVERFCGTDRARRTARAEHLVSPRGTCSVSVPAA